MKEAPGYLVHCCHYSWRTLQTEIIIIIIVAGRDHSLPLTLYSTTKQLIFSWKKDRIFFSIDSQYQDPRLMNTSVLQEIPNQGLWELPVSHQHCTRLPSSLEHWYMSINITVWYNVYVWNNKFAPQFNNRLRIATDNVVASPVNQTLAFSSAGSGGMVT